MADDQAPERMCEDCGRPLSVYNDESRCSTCQRSFLDLYRTLPPIPAQVWADREVREALAGWDFGAVARLVRERAGLRQEKIAELTGLSQGFLSQLESGRGTLVDIRKIKRFLDGLGTPSDLLPRPTDRPRPDAPPSGAVVLDREELATESREPGGFLGRLRRDIARMVELDGRFGGDDVLPLALRLFRTSHRRLVASTMPGDERDLQAAVAEAGEVAGWVAYDADELGVARRLSLEALHLARLAGDASMERFTFANLAMVNLQMRQPGEALAIAEHVLDGHPTGRVGALFTVRAARGWAQQSEGRRALGALDRARVLLDEGIAVGDPSWSWWFDLAELAWHRATVHAELGDWAAAVEDYHEAYETRAAAAGQASPRPRVVQNDLAHLLEALAAVEGWADIEVLLPTALDDVGEIGSARTRRVLRQVVRRATRAKVKTSTVEDQVEALAAKLDRQATPT